MARFVLQPCRLRAERLVPDRNAEPLELDWAALCEQFVPSHSREGLLNLRRLQPGCYVGLADNPQTGRVGNFIFLNADRTGDLRWVLKRDQSLTSRIRAVFRVEMAEWDHTFEELPA